MMKRKKVPRKRVEGKLFASDREVPGWLKKLDNESRERQRSVAMSQPPAWDEAGDSALF